MPVPAKPAQLKIYTVEIIEEEFPKAFFGIWYRDKGGQRFTCCLIAKDLGSYFGAVFLIIDGTDKMPTIIRTIRPEHCKIVGEEVKIVHSNFIYSLKEAGRKIY